MLVKVIEATAPAVSLERAKERLNILHNDFDFDIQKLIKAASEAYERETNTALGPSTWELRLYCWPWWWPNRCRPWGIDLGIYPVRAVESVKYLDTAGAEQTVDPANWFFDRTAAGGTVGFVNSWSVPWLYDRDNAVRVRFVAGYDDPAAPGSDSELTMPVSAELAIISLVGHWLQWREAIMAEGAIPYEVPLSFKYLSSQLKVYR